MQQEISCLRINLRNFTVKLSVMVVIALKNTEVVKKLVQKLLEDSANSKI